MRVSVLALLAAAAIAAPVAEPVADAVAAEAGYKPTPTAYAPKPTYGAPAPKYSAQPEINPLEVLSDAALAVLKFKLYLIEQGAKIILTPFEIAYQKLHDVKPEYPAPGKTYYARDYKPEPYKPEPKPAYGGGKEVNPFEVISDAALAVLRFKLALIEAGAKIILSPFEQSYNDKYHPKPEYPAPGKTYYARGEYQPEPYKPEPKPTYGGEGANPAEVLGDAALALLKFKLALLAEGAKIVLTPFEIAYAKLHDLKPEYPAPKPTYGAPAPKPTKSYY